MPHWALQLQGHWHTAWIIATLASHLWKDEYAWTLMEQTDFWRGQKRPTWSVKFLLFKSRRDWCRLKQTNWSISLSSVSVFHDLLYQTTVLLPEMMAVGQEDREDGIFFARWYLCKNNSILGGFPKDLKCVKQCCLKQFLCPWITLFIFPYAKRLHCTFTLSPGARWWKFSRSGENFPRLSCPPGTPLAGGRGGFLLLYSGCVYL